MKIIFLIFFIVLSFFLMFKASAMIEKKRLMIFYGVGMVLTILLFIISPAIVFGISKVITIDHNEIDKVLKALFLSFLCLFFLNLFILLVVENLINFLTGFHQANNQVNLNRSPIRTVIENKSRILTFVKIVFFILGQCLPYYGIWIGSYK
ncbi:hypothetical protein [Chryseobacterium arthrosphaerae]|uniref:hypothetical protein n=1 Tax=Chryseobacterium arthrosphaerae TaxID=651561 RepID=UPI0023E1EF20|nr:hypothetical protein [Chryseobacterium arthrosphaerae]WES97522.1 hypothetical protein P2W68_22250 [Chryseobacterium arthrosphaerae]